MAVNDMMNRGGFDADAARYDRMNRTQPAQFAPGQDATFQQSDVFSQSAVPNQSNAMGDIFSSGIGTPQPLGEGLSDPFNPNAGLNTGAIPQGTGFNQNPMQQQGQKSAEDRFWDAAVAGGKGAFSFFKELTTSFKELTPRFYSEYGRRVMWAGLIVGVLGIVLRLFGLSIGLKIAIGGLVSMTIGVVAWGVLTEKAKNYTSMYKDENNTNQSMLQQTSSPTIDPITPTSDFGDSSDFNSSQEDWGDFNIKDDSSWDEDDDGVDDYGNDEDDDIDDFADVEVKGEEGMDADTALSSLQGIPVGMYTRQYLFDAFNKVLPTLRPDFAQMKEYDEADENFLNWDEMLREAAQAAGCKEDFLPELQRLQENLFVIKVTCDRPTGFKPEAVANELASMYAYKDGERNEAVYATYDTVGMQCIITIYTGDSALVSLKDMYSQVKTEILKGDKYYMPVILGIDQNGKVIWCDFKKIESCIVAGMPRSGKSWLVQAILTQLCAFVPPSELNFYIFDPKAGTSDFKAFCLPHVKKFASRYKNEQGTIVNPDSIGILDTLEQIVRIEAPRRKKLLGDAGVVNIWDFRKKYPDVDLPLLYIIIDEAVTLAEDMEKEEKSAYQSYVTQLITQFPNLGIRAFLIPHVVKDQIIKKTATDSVKCRISVKGSPDHIEASTGTKPRDFKYKLCNVGDMAVNMPDISPKTMFVHGVAITDDNEKNNQIFDYLRRMWIKLDPSCADTEVSKNAEIEIANQKALDSLEDDSSIDEVWTNSNDDGLSGMNTDAIEDDDFSLF